MATRHSQNLDPAHCADLIKRSRCLVALTGAGISTAAGIPDFRGPQGLYVTRRYDPEKVFDIMGFDSQPRDFFDFSRDFVDTVKGIEPTFTHRFLAALESSGILKGVITQNIDTLHQAAGSRNIVELHGSYRSATCRSCKKHYVDRTYAWWDEAMRSSPRAPVVLCPECSGVIKPDIVFFGEPVRDFLKAEVMVSQTDLFLVLGSSLSVSPASLLPISTSATTIVVNKGEVALNPAPYRYFVREELDAYWGQAATCLGMHL